MKKLPKKIERIETDGDNWFTYANSYGFYEDAHSSDDKEGLLLDKLNQTIDTLNSLIEQNEEDKKGK